MSPLDRLLQRRRIAEAKPFLRGRMRVLDVGSADGALRVQMPNIAAYVGIDPEAATGDGLVRGVFPDDLPAQEPFDAIVLLAVLEHIPAEQLPAFAGAVRDHLAPAGVVVITVPSPFVDRILDVLKALRLIQGMSLEQHYGFEVARVPGLFAPPAFELVAQRRFQLGLNHLFVFRRT
jgi:hypothetical protein